MLKAREAIENGIEFHNFSERLDARALNEQHVAKTLSKKRTAFTLTIER